MASARWARVLLQVTVCLGLLASLLIAQETISLVGSGSNLVGSLYSAWTAEYGKAHSGTTVRYLPLGTAQSLQEIRAGTGDFGGGEIPLTEAQKHSGKYTLVQIPTVLVAIVPIYKLPGKPELRFNGDVLAGIYLGNIKNWNDPRIAKLNPGVTFPDLPISVVHLSGVKGSSYILTDYLSKTSPEWKSKIGKSGAPNWPVGDEVNRSEGMVNKVSATSGAIGYVELSYARRKDIGYGSVQNAAGQFVRPTNATITAACIANEKSMPADFGVSLTDAPGRESYPMASLTWIYMPASGLPAARSHALKDFWSWALAEGQPIAGGLGYTELPSSIAAKAREVINSVE
jgi:phosphate transport system substrate-binding protein